ncbi:MAG: alpha/beta fold hydrolase [Pirellulales bacterium]
MMYLARRYSATRLLFAETIALLGFFALAGNLRADEPAEEPTDPRRPTAIATTGVPALPDALVARLAQYQNVRPTVFQGWSPDGKGILIGTRFGNATQLHRVYTPGGRREQITFFEEPASGRFVPGETSKAVLVSMSAGGNEDFQIHLVDLAAFRTTLLTDGKSRNQLGPVSENGSRMIVMSNRRNGKDTDIYVADTRKSDSMKLLLETDGEFWQPSDWSPDGKTLFLIQYVSINETYPALLDVETGKLDKLPLPGEKPVAIDSGKFSEDGKTVYLSTDASGEFHQLTALDVATKKYRALVDDIPWDVQAIEVSRETGRIAFTVNEDGASRLYLFGADGKARAVDVPLGIIGSLEFSPDGTQLGFTLARPDAPADAYSVVVADSKASGDKSEQLTRWTYSEVGGLDPDLFIKPERIAFESFDERKVPAYYYKPRGASADKPAAVVIHIHGGPESQYRPLFSGTSQYYLNELGFAVICPNVRGSAGYGKTYLKLDNAERREDSVKDIGALLDWIARRPELDAKRVAVEGGSYGGYMVLASLTHFPDRLRAGTDVVGIANFITFLEKTAPYRRDLRRAEYGDERDPAMRAVFARINPTANADKIRSSLLVIHGRNDPRVPFFEAEQIADIVRKQDKPVWTVYADNEGHGFGKKDNRDYMAAVMALFLSEQLKAAQ